MFRRDRPESPSFAGFRFPADVILLAVRWYLRYGLSYRDIEELLAESVWVPETPSRHSEQAFRDQASPVPALSFRGVDVGNGTVASFDRGSRHPR